jgi:hypothetical protein
MENRVLFDYLDTYSDLEKEIITDKVNEIDTCIDKLNKGQDLSPYQFEVVSDILSDEKRRLEQGGFDYIHDLVIENFFTDIYNGLFPEEWLDKPVKVSGSMGFWNGRKEIEPLYYKDLEQCFKTLLMGYDDFRLKQEGDNYILHLIHHDSRHILTIESVETIPQKEEE